MFCLSLAPLELGATAAAPGEATCEDRAAKLNFPLFAMAARFAGWADAYCFLYQSMTELIFSFLRCLSMLKFLFCTLAVWTRCIGFSPNASVVLVEANPSNLKSAVDLSYGSIHSELACDNLLSSALGPSHGDSQVGMLSIWTPQPASGSNAIGLALFVACWEEPTFLMVRACYDVLLSLNLWWVKVIISDMIPLWGSSSMAFKFFLSVRAPLTSPFSYSSILMLM